MIVHRKRIIDDCLKANTLAMKELTAQRHALIALRDGQHYLAKELIPYASRMQQAATNGAVAYAVFIGEIPPQTC